MAIHERAIVIGLTGPFGSGSTTAASILKERLHFKDSLLSSFIQKAWREQHPNEEPKRSDLQNHGDSMRKEKGPGILAQLALNDLKSNTEVYERIVFDGLRNVAEIEYLRDQFG